MHVNTSIMLLRKNYGNTDWWRLLSP